MTNVPIKSKVLQKNDEIAAANRGLLHRQGLRCLNLIGSPGSGKTTLLEALFLRLAGNPRCAVIEGDVKTDNDMRRVEATGVPAVQIQTDGACHLTAVQIQAMLGGLPLDTSELLIIENVGNLICPVSYDLGEDKRLIVLSVAEGVDKPLKYPSAFMSADVLVITKIDLAPHVDVKVDALAANALSINPKLTVLKTSAKTGEGMDGFESFIRNLVAESVA